MGCSSALISAHQRQLHVITRGHQWPSVAIRGTQLTHRSLRWRWSSSSACFLILISISISIAIAPKLALELELLLGLLASGLVPREQTDRLQIVPKLRILESRRPPLVLAMRVRASCNQHADGKRIVLASRPVQRGRLIVVALVHVDAGFDQQGAALW